MKPKFLQGLFCLLVVVTLLTPFWVFKDLLFPYITSKAYFLRILVEITLPLYIYFILAYKNYRPSFKNPLTLAVVAFLVLNTISAIFGVNPLRSFWGNFERMGGVFYLAHLTLLYFYVLLLGQMSQQYMKAFLLSVISIGGLASVYGILVKLSGNHFLMNDPSYPRISATFGNPIFFASFLIIPMFLTVYYMLGEEIRWKKWMYGVIAALELYCILLSGTRGAIVGLAIGLFVSAIIFVVRNPQKKLRVWGGAALVGFLLVLGLAFSFHNSFPQGSMLRRVFNLRDTNSEARLIQWGVALKGYKDAPILGVGPEDYYVVSNKYYNPEIYKYDPSWFDKPHNYLIEVLITTGTLGFAAYAAMMICFVFVLWMAYKKELLTLLEFCLLLTSALAYQIQNLFVFDTISASIMFFVFLGFGGFLWQESRSLETNPKKKMEPGLNKLFVNTAVGFSAALMLYTLYIGNVTGLKIAKAINYGYAYAGVNPQTAKDFFERARNSPFNFDPIQFGNKYGDFANGLAADPKDQALAFVNQNLDEAIEVQTDSVRRVSNDPSAFQQLANLYLTASILNKTGLNPKALEAARTAVELAPRRPEPALMLARLYIYQNNTTTAESLLQSLIQNIPENVDAKLQLALMYAYTGNVDKALKMGEDLFSSGFKPSRAAQVEWLGQLYMQREEWQKAAGVYELALQAEPNNTNNFWQLAQVYAKLGRKQEAIAMAKQLMQASPTQAVELQKFIDSLK